MLSPYLLSPRQRRARVPRVRTRIFFRAGYEDVGDAKERLLASLSKHAHVGGKAVVDDGKVWCPAGWTVVTRRRGANDKSAGAAYHQWHAPDGAKREAASFTPSTRVEAGRRRL